MAKTQRDFLAEYDLYTPPLLFRVNIVIREYIYITFLFTAHCPYLSGRIY